MRRGLEVWVYRESALEGVTGKLLGVSQTDGQYDGMSVLRQAANYIASIAGEDDSPDVWLSPEPVPEQDDLP